VFLSAVEKGVRIQVRAQPGARKSEIVGPHGDALKIKIAAPPEDGKANTELEEFLAARLGIAKSHVSVISGHASRSKGVLIQGMELSEVREKLCE
jgi:uncharacterized protein (TIGR00251 family)